MGDPDARLIPAMALVQDLRQGPLCRTFARGPCAGPKPGAHVQDPCMLARQGTMCKTHACRAQLCNTRDSDDFLTSGHEITIPMMHAAHGHLHN
jgi:hypothetical protein